MFLGMELKAIFTSIKGHHYSIYEGNIKAEELELDDKLYWMVGRGLNSHHLAGRVSIISAGEILLDLSLEDQTRPRLLGRHILKNLDINGERSSLGARPFRMGYRFKESVEKQVGMIDGIPFDDLAKRTIAPGSPWLVRRT